MTRQWALKTGSIAWSTCLLIIFVAGMKPVTAFADACLETGVYLYLQSEVDNFQAKYGPGCYEIGGSLEITGHDITNLDGLAGIYSVGDLGVYRLPNLSSLAGLSALESVGDYVQLTNLPLIRDFNELFSLTTVEGDLYVGSNENLESIGMASLQTIQGQLTITRNPRLQKIDLDTLSAVDKLEISENDVLTAWNEMPELRFTREIRVFRNPLLVELSALSGLELVENFVSIFSNESLKNLDGLKKLMLVGGSISISGNPKIERINLPALEYTGAFRISQAPLLTDLTGVEGVEMMGLTVQELLNLRNIDALSHLNGLLGGLNISFNPHLKNIDALSGIQIIDGSLYINGNNSLENLNGLAGVELITGSSVEIIGNDNLTDVTGLADTMLLGIDLTIEDNNTLEDFNAFNRNLRLWGYLRILENDSLIRVSGFQNMIDEVSRISIIGNDSLSDLRGLEQLQSMWGELTVKENPSLSDCSVFRVLLDDIDDGYPGPGPGPDGMPDIRGDVRIEDNEFGCNSVFEALGGVFISSFE